MAYDFRSHKSVVHFPAEHEFFNLLEVHVEETLFLVDSSDFVHFFGCKPEVEDVDILGNIT